MESSLFGRIREKLGTVSAAVEIFAFVNTARRVPGLTASSPSGSTSSSLRSKLRSGARERSAWELSGGPEKSSSRWRWRASTAHGPQGPNLLNSSGTGSRCRKANPSRQSSVSLPFGAGDRWLRRSFKIGALSPSQLPSDPRALICTIAVELISEHSIRLIRSPHARHGRSKPLRSSLGG